MATGKKLTEKEAWEYLSERWSKPKLRHYYYAVDVAGYSFSGLCLCIDRLFYEFGVIEETTYNSMMKKIEAHANTLGTTSRNYIWERDYRGAVTRHLFCKTEAEKL